MNDEIKRLFFGIEVHAPWPEKLPRGRLLDEIHRHLTLAFLGNIPFAPLQSVMEQFPSPSMKVGTVGYFDACLLLPPRHPHVVAWHAKWWDEQNPIITFQKKLSAWLASLGYSLDDRPWEPHATLCRSPFDSTKWKEAFAPLPFYTASIHLYESTGRLQYVPIWTLPIVQPFQEIDHTADMAFLIRGETLGHLYLNAFAALAYKAPSLLEFFSLPIINSLDDLIIALNASIGRADSAVGCPMKAVSFHGEAAPLSDSILQWEMIVDV